jgi:hypothetical protein
VSRERSVSSPRSSRIGAKRVVLMHLGPDMLARSAEVAEEIAEDGEILRL